MTEELRTAYFQSFLATPEARMVLADIYSCVYSDKDREKQTAERILGRIDLVQGILCSCGVNGVAMIAALERAAAQGQVTEPEEETDLHGE